MKEGIIIATVKYHYAKIGPYCTKRHRPSLDWTISNSSRPTIERSSKNNVTPLAENKSNQISSRALYKWQATHHYSSPRSVYSIYVIATIASHCYSHCCWYTMFTDNFRQREMQQQDKARPQTARVTMDFQLRTTLLYCHDPKRCQI